MGAHEVFQQPQYLQVHSFSAADAAHATSIRPITGRPSLFPPSFTHSPFGTPYGFLPAVGRTEGLPCSEQVTERVRFALFAGGVACPRGRRSETSFPPQCLLAQATQHLRLVPLNDVYQAFAYANHTTHPSPLSALMLADTSVASRFHWQRWC